METVFIVQHVHELDQEREDIKLIGVYRTHADANQAIDRLKKQPGFDKNPDGFHIDEYELNKDHWIEGFISV